MTGFGDVLAVGFGGFLGAVARYGITVAAIRSPLASSVWGGPAWGTTVANLLGCLILGMVFQAAAVWAVSEDAGWSPRTILLVKVGVLGSLTTFSTLVGETVVLSSGGKPLAALTLVLVNLTLGTLLFWGGAASIRWVTA